MANKSRSRWTADILIVVTFAAILAILSVVNIRTLQQTYEQNERLQDVNQYLDCLDPTTSCGKKLAEYNSKEREWLTETMRSQAICTLLTSRTIRETNIIEMEQGYNECVEARQTPQPKPTESPIEKKVEKGSRP